MTHRIRLWVGRVALLSAVVLASAGTGYAVEEVRVNNFPQTQNVKGSVNVDGTISHARSFKREGVLVQPGRRNDMSELTYAGSVDTEGFTTLSTSLQGEIKSNSVPAGAIGILLIPEEDPILRVLRDAKLVQFPIECVATINKGDAEYFSSQPCQDRIVFPRYRIYLYNNLNRTVEANLYLYLSN